MTFRPALRPGASLLRRDATTLQVGTSPGVVIPDRPGLYALLRVLDGSRDLERLQVFARDHVPELDVAIVDLVRELCALHVVFDASRWSAPQRRGLDAEARHADLAGEEPARLVARTAFRLAFRHDSASRPIIDSARAVLAESGVQELDSADPHLLVIASCGEPARAVFERPTLDGIVHLPVVIDENRIRIGPLVSPGRTPCVSCHDLHRADWDHAWTALVPQLGRRPMTPAALSAVVVHAAALELAVDVLNYCDGRPVRSVGQFLVVGPRHDDRGSWPLAFHHGCACDLLSAA